jgi:hypothetical protein
MEEDFNVEAAEYQIEIAEDLKRLQADPKFARIFQELFIDAFAITNTMNMAMNDQATDARTFAKLKARGEYCSFCQQILTDGVEAQENLAAYNSTKDKVVEIG